MSSSPRSATHLREVNAWWRCRYGGVCLRLSHRPHAVYQVLHILQVALLTVVRRASPLAWWWHSLVVPLVGHIWHVWHVWHVWQLWHLNN